MDRRWFHHRRENRGAVFRGPIPPFGGTTVEGLAAWADGRLDISRTIGDTGLPVLWFQAPEVVETVLAERFGWDAVRGPGPLTWHEAKLYLQLDAERKVGRPMREAELSEHAREDAAYDASVKAASR